MAFLIQNWKGL